MSLLPLLAFVILVFAFTYTRTNMKRKRMARLSWNDLVARLEPVPNDGISAVAVDYLRPEGGQLKIETNEIWELIGGPDGVNRMYANSEVLVALAQYVRRWNPAESAVFAERMRRDAVSLRRAVFMLSFGVMVGNNSVYGPFNLQEAASAYYLMRERLLALYETNHAGRYERLAAAL